MLIVAGHLDLDPREREPYLEGCRTVVEQAAGAPGCLDFAITPDLLEPGRIRIFERWDSREAVEGFRGSGPSGEQAAMLLAVSVAEYEVTSGRDLG